MFWRQTPRETYWHLRMLAARERLAFALALYAAWHAEAFARCDRLPELAPMIDGLRDGAPAEQDPEEQLRAARGIALAFGGATEVR